MATRASVVPIGSARVVSASGYWAAHGVDVVIEVREFLEGIDHDPLEEKEIDGFRQGEGRREKGDAQPLDGRVHHVRPT